MEAAELQQAAEDRLKNSSDKEGRTRKERRMASFVKVFLWNIEGFSMNAPIR